MLYNAAMDKFYALAEPTRRKILEMLAEEGQLSATEISGRFDVSASAISQHLKVLRVAGLVQMEKRAQQRLYRINPDAMLEVADWARHTTQVWRQRLDAFDAVLKAEKQKEEEQQNGRK